MTEQISDKQLALSLHRLEELWQRVDELPQPRGESWRPTEEFAAQPQDLLKETLEGLSVSLQELQVAAEELHQENEELAKSLTVVKAERQHYLELFKLAPDGYLVTTKDGTILEANQRVGELLNVVPERLITKPLVVFVDPQERRDFYSKLSQLQKGESIKNWQVQLQRWRGAFFSASLAVTPIQDSQGEVIGLRWQLQDLTPTDDAELTDPLFRAMFENAAVGIALLDSQGGVIKSNRALQEMLGYNSQELQRFLLEWLNLDEAGVDSVLFQQLMMGKRYCYQREKCYSTQDRSLRWGRLTFSLVQGAGKKPTFVTCMVEDITELHQIKAEQQKAIAQKQAIKQQAIAAKQPEISQE